MWRRKVLAELTFLTASAIVFGWLGILIIKLALLPQNLGGMLKAPVQQGHAQEPSAASSSSEENSATVLRSLQAELLSLESDGSNSSEPKPDG
jgi:hypothetical protein